MTIKDLSSTVLLAIAGALAIVAVALVLFMPSATVNAIAAQLGLRAEPMGAAAADSPDNDTQVGQPIRKPSPHGSRSGLRGREVPLEEASLTHGQSLIPQSSSGGYKTEPAKSDRTSSNVEGPAVKATSMEQGHLIEKYLYLNGGVVLFIDGRILDTSGQPLAKHQP